MTRGKAPQVRPCPICGQKARLLVFEQEFVVYACTECGVHFRPPVEHRDKGDHFVQVRMDLYSRSVGVVRERSYKTLVEIVRSYVPTGRWLDVGCSFGWLLRYVQSHGFDPYGIEPSPSAARVAQEHGLPVEIGTYPDKGPSNIQYQVISFMDVLEHLPEPGVALEAARHHLSPNGVLVVQVPDRRSFLYRTAELLFRVSGGCLGVPLRRLYLDGLDFPHTFYHSLGSLRVLLERSGFHILQTYCTPIGSWDMSVSRVAYLETPRRAVGTTYALGIGIGVLQLLDNWCGHGGLLVAVSRSRKMA